MHEVSRERGRRGRSRTHPLGSLVVVLALSTVPAFGARAAGADPPPASPGADGQIVATTSGPTTTAGVTPPDPLVPGPEVSDPAGPATDPSLPLPPLLEAGIENVAPYPQDPFDEASKARLAEQLADAMRRSRRLERDLAASAKALTPLVARRVELVSGGDLVEGASARSAADVASVREDLRRQAVAAFVRSDREVSLLSDVGNADHTSRGLTFLAALRARRAATLADLETRRSALTDVARVVSDELAPLDVAITDGEARIDWLTAAASATQTEVVAYMAGSHIFVSGFRFPVLGPVSFVDSWGAPRMVGTAHEHWHEGTDIMAPIGRELVATEDGVVGKVGTAGLGGQRLWLYGTSGTHYYYAHLSAFAPGLVDGAVVSAGQILGYVGDTGNAKGGAPHLHFEIRPGGGPPVNPFPLLAATWGTQPMPSEPEALAGPGSVLAPGSTFATGDRDLEGPRGS